MKYDFYDDMSMINNFMPYDMNNYSDFNNLNNMTGVPSVNNSNNLNIMKSDFDYEVEMLNTNNVNANNNELDLYSPYEGYMRGNAFRSQYIPYKNYQPQKINITSERDEMLVNIGQYSFMAHEMNLYLDTNPNDREALRRFQEFRDKSNELVKTYERKYGPLSVSGDVSNQTPFNWVTTEWPWEK